MTDPHKWIDAYLDGELSAADAASFDEWLRRDPRHVEAFVRQARYHGNSLNGNNLTGALPNAPIAGRWFDAMFVQLVQNAYPSVTP